ncbi:hypothetical protein OPV22_021196 [Ensete ventricosum]|uniref:RING-type domain-containing protein n=1 Tax=Ensete ventricosum TaxID=4639 RepID=A0AAV8QCD8_ENSVE|nr:hypothetical protein OPV22_021196 [Ensete ventricosum]
MAAGRGYTSGRLEQLMSGGGGGGDGTTRGLVQVILGVVGPSQEVAGEDRSPPDRIVLVNPVTQGMVVLQGDPDLMAEILSERGVGDGGRGAGDPPPASKESIEAMRTVSVEEGEGMRQEECPVCLDELVEGGKEASAAAAVVVVREMPCGHRFHEGCIVKWLGMNGSCPVCRFRMPPEEGGDPKKDDGEGEGAENDEQRRRIRGMWLTIVYRRGRGEISDQPSQSPGEEGGGRGYSGGDAAAAGYGRRIHVMKHYEAWNSPVPSHKEDSRMGREMTEMEMDYPEPGANTNPRGGAIFGSPPPSPPVH